MCLFPARTFASAPYGQTWPERKVPLLFTLKAQHHPIIPMEIGARMYLTSTTSQPQSLKMLVLEVVAQPSTFCRTIENELGGVSFFHSEGQLPQLSQ